MPTKWMIATSWSSAMRTSFAISSAGKYAFLFPVLLHELLIQLLMLTQFLYLNWLHIKFHMCQALVCLFWKLMGKFISSKEPCFTAVGDIDLSLNATKLTGRLPCCPSRTIWYLAYSWGLNAASRFTSVTRCPPKLLLSMNSSSHIMYWKDEFGRKL